MLQPFVLLKNYPLERFIKLGKRYFVTQSYPRANNPLAEKQNINILVSDYDDPGLAKIHFSAISHDKYAAIIDLKKEKHLQKIKEMLSSDSAYELYWAAVTDAAALKNKLKKKYANHIRKFIDEHTQWRISRQDEFRPQLEVRFGDIFVIFKKGSERIDVPLSEIEKIKL